MDEHVLKLLRHRFIEDTSAPIQVLIDPYFTERLTLFNKEFGYLDEYAKYVDFVEKNYKSVEEFLESYHSLRDRIIEKVSNSEAYKDFQADEKITAEIKAFTPVIGNVNLYTQEQVKEGSNYFLAFDMKKANFQTLKWINPAILFDCDTYDDFMRKFTDMEIAIKSKRTREIIFGKLNPNRTTKYERILMGIVEETIRETEVVRWFDLFSLNNDEVIYKLKPGVNYKDAINAISKHVSEEHIFNLTGIDVRMEFFTLECYHFKTSYSDKVMNVFVKRHHTGKNEYKCANEIYFPQTYKLINGIEVNDNDLVFYYDKTELCKFFKPIELVSNE
jgi:hypothetical protein